MIFEPVCGNNGKTYANECLMKEDACRHQRDATVLFHGECSSGTMTASPDDKDSNDDDNNVDDDVDDKI